MSRRLYLRAGLALAALKYLGDAAIVYAFTRMFWSPLRYAMMSWSLSVPDPKRAAATLASDVGNAIDPRQAMYVLLALWAMPFLWIGMSMTLRRCADAGLSMRHALFFFVPFVSYLLMATLCVVNTRDGGWVDSRPVFIRSRRSAFLIGTMAGVAILMAAGATSVFALQSYGAALFIGAPFVSGFVSAFVLTRGYPAVSAFGTTGVAVASVVTAGTTLLLVAWEGVFCLAMALPLAGGVAVLGALMGHAIAARNAQTSPVIALLLAWPILTAAEAHSTQPEVHELLSVIEIDRTPHEIWPHVIAFGELLPPSEWYFRGGIAYPQRARIESSGVGAVRYCEFSTGPFVEPITRWDPPHRLAFSVRSQPAPMSELSPYREVMAPHLEGNLRSERGEFRLIELPNRRTRIEARTWYSVDMYPQVYWRLWSDSIIHAIHMRVLQHIARESGG